MASPPRREARPVRSPWRAGAVLPAWVLATFILEAVAVIVLSLLSHHGLEERAINAELTTYTLEALDGIDTVHSLVADAEAAERGYLLTGNARYLDPFNLASGSAPTELADLRRFLDDTPAQVAKYELLQKLVGDKLADLRDTIDLRRTGKMDAALDATRQDRGDVTMGLIRDVVAGMKADKQSVLKASLKRAGEYAGTLRLIIVAEGLVLISLLLASAYTTRRAFHDREVQSWARTGHNLLATRLQGEQRLEQVGENVISFFAEYLDACAGAVHVASADGRFAPCGGFALSSDRTAAPVRLGEGLVGQAAKENRVLHVTEVPEGYLAVASSLGAGKPRELVLVPTTSDGETNGVIELGFFRHVGAAEMDLLAGAAESVGLAFRSAKWRALQAELLEETQRQAQELQEQQEELKATNEELEEQTRRLQASQLKLEQQQAQLEETNAQLEEQAHTVESQRDAILATQRLLQDKADELERGSRYKSEFLANMSHELRTPLNSSLILSRLLVENRDGNLTPEQVKFAQSIYSAGNDLLALINDILDLAKIEAGRVDLSIEPVLVARLFDNLKRRFEPLAAEREIALHVSIGAGCPQTIETDFQRLQQVLTNLLSNAVKFTEQGTISLTAELKDATHLAFTVSDTGVGIAPEQHGLIFEAFRQADGTINRKYGGTGLGLSISRELVALLDGEIELSSAPGNGSSFIVTLPLRTAVERPAAVSQVRATPPLESGRSTERQAVADDRDQITDPRRVLLVVEDDPVFAEILRDLGRELHFQCLVAGDATEGLRLVRAHKPVAIILDMNLPDHSGLTVLEHLKRDPSTRHVPVHVVSIHDYQRVARELGVVGYALKPVKREELVAAFELLEARIARKAKSVLVVEDDAVQREAIAKLLQADGVSITAVARAEDALAQLKRATFDCCVVDLMLPDVSGFELLERMSADEACSFPPVIIYTARPLGPEEERRLRRSSSSIIVKGARSPERLLEEVTLFLHQVESELPPEKQRMLRAARDREAAFEGRRILLVEDDVRNLFALTRVLEPKGLLVDVARNGREALARLADEPSIELVLMDVMMPEMDGLTATRQIRKAERWSDLPIIALTAKAMPDDRKACLDAGANDYVAKPVDVEKLLSLLRVWMPR